MVLVHVILFHHLFYNACSGIKNICGLPDNATSYSVVRSIFKYLASLFNVTTDISGRHCTFFLESYFIVWWCGALWWTVCTVL